MITSAFSSPLIGWSESVLVKASKQRHCKSFLFSQYYNCFSGFLPYMLCTVCYCRFSVHSEKYSPSVNLNTKVLNDREKQPHTSSALAP